MTFIAAIRRLPGGAFAKVPRSLSMTAVPVQTTISNLATYFDQWPKRRATFLVYGPTRQIGTAAGRPNGDARTKAVPGDEPGSEEFTLYGPKPVAPKPSPAGGQGGSGAAAQADAQAKAKAAAAAARPLGLAGVLRRFRKGEKLAMVTAYDFPSSRSARAAGVDLVLVGDSVGNCRLGLPDTIGVTMDDMLRATKAARRGIDANVTDPAGPKPVLIGDMPFGSYLVQEDALKNAAAFRVAGADMIKLEGGRHVVPLIRALKQAGIAVMGHIGLEPQSAFLQGGLRMQGTTAPAAMELVEAAQELAEAGAVMIVLECVPSEVGHAVQAAVPNTPVIGIGAGKEVAGQVLVCDDFLGVHGSAPSFVKQYADLAKLADAAYKAYALEVRSGTFPGEAHSRKLAAEELVKLKGLLPKHSWPEACAEAAEKEVPVAIAAKGAPRGSVTQRTLGQPIAPVPTMEIISGAFSQINHAARAMSVTTTPGKVNVTATPGKVEVLRTRAELKAWRTKNARKVGLVPTMGNLHEGHLELIDEAKRHADDVLATLFVNPAQFAAHEDLDKYPRTFEQDLQKLQERGTSAVFAPQPEEMYPHGSPGGTVVVPTFLRGKSEDSARPHFFTGVATVCLKLFNLTQPDVAVFGQKDAMQCVMISRMVQDLMLDDRLSIVIAPTSREADGLARSSRNSYLTPGMRAKAPAIYAALCSATQAAGATPGSVRSAVREELTRAGMEVTYVSVADGLEMNEKADDALLANSVVSIACLLREGDLECRLIDNVVVPA